MKRLDLLVGVKSEQSLRDAVRETVEKSDGASDGLELAPVGKKDWVAGKRYDSALLFGDLDKILTDVLATLIGLGAQQRIRRENIRIYSVKPHVPVFKDVVDMPEKDRAPEENTTETKVADSASCPSCGLVVNAYNLLHNASGAVVGCYICRGEKRRF